MRVLIAYAGRTGTTERAARMLASFFHDASLRNLRETDTTPERYDAVVVGTCIRGGQIEPVVRKWLIRHEKQIYGMRKGIFLINAFMDEVPDVIRNNFPEELVKACVAVDSFGGEIDFGKLSYTEKMSLKMKMRRRKESESAVIPCLLTDSIELFARKIEGTV